MGVFTVDTETGVLDSEQCPYAHTLLGRLERRIAGRKHKLTILVLVLGCALMVPTVQFIIKIQDTEYSVFREREDHDSAIGRWIPDGQEVRSDGNPYSSGHWFPAPPVVLLFVSWISAIYDQCGIVLVGVLWSLLKLGAVITGFMLLINSVQTPRKGIPIGVMVLAALFSMRPVIADITHGNINLFVFFEITCVWYFFVRGRDLWAGLFLALAITTKVTPALLLLYFIYKRAWKLSTAALIGLLIFAYVLPTLWWGGERTRALSSSWYRQMVTPYTEDGWVTVESINQSLPGMIMKHAAFPHFVSGSWYEQWSAEIERYDLPADSPELEKLEALRRVRDRLQSRAQIVSYSDWLSSFLPTEIAGHEVIEHTGQLFMARFSSGATRWVVRGVILVLLVLMLWLWRTPLKERSDPRLLLELGIVLLGMALFSERTWKHHLVTLPIVYLGIWQVLLTLAWSARFRLLMVCGLVAQFVLLVVVKNDWAMYAGVITVGLLLCLVQLAALLVCWGRTEPPGVNQISAAPS